MTSTRRALVVGGGFIARSLVSAFTDHFRTTVVSRFSDYFELAWPMVDARGSLSSLDSGIDWDLVVFCSGPSTPSAVSPVLSEKSTLELRCLLEKTVRSRAFVYMSSGGALYAPTEGTLSEHSVTDLSSSYASMHLRNEQLVRSYVSIPSRISFRLGNPFGVYQDPSRSVGFVSQALICALEGRELEILGDGSTQRDFFHVSSISKALLTIDYSRCREFELFNFGSGESTSLLGVIDCVEKATNRTIKAKFSQINSVGRPAVKLSVDKLRAYFPGVSVIGLKEGVEIAFRDLLLARKKGA